jgi:hypothetical protein
MAVETARVSLERVARSIVVVRGHPVILDRELAAIYGVTTKRLNEQAKRKRRTLPTGFHVSADPGRAPIFKVAICDLEYGPRRPPKPAHRSIGFTADLGKPEP